MNQRIVCDTDDTHSPTLSLGRTTTPGRRAENQDRECAFTCDLGEGFLVADGMGGREGGATAAEIVVERLPKLLQDLPPGTDVMQALLEVTRRVNLEVQDAQGSVASHRDMGSTMVLALRADQQLWIAHVGDSRAYLFRKGTLSRLTTDHTVAQQTIGASGASDEEVRRHPSASVLTKVIGQPDELIPDINGPIPLFEGDGVLLCSDGLSGFASDIQIQQVLRQGRNATSLTCELEELALASESTDNVTVQFIQVMGGRPISHPPATTVDSPARRRAWIALSVAAAFVVAWAAIHFAYVLYGASKKAPASIQMKLDP